jgi:uncharacterized metal-binding protein
MPSGQTHDRITLWTLPVAAGLTLAVTHSSTLTLIVSGGFLFSGLMLGPDLDVRSVQFKRWGWLRWIWIPYRGSLRHRSPYSHAPVTGTVVRVAYLLLWLGLIGFVSLTIANELLQLGWTWEEIAGVMRRSLHHYWLYWIALAVGLELGALSHYLADWGISTHKQVQKKGWKAIFPKPQQPKKGTRKKAGTTRSSPKQKSGRSHPR